MWIGIQISQPEDQYIAQRFGLSVLGSDTVLFGEGRLIRVNEGEPNFKLFLLNWLDENSEKPISFVLQNDVNATSRPLPTNVVCIGIDLPEETTDDAIITATQNIYAIGKTSTVDDVHETLVCTLLDEVILTPKTDFLSLTGQSFPAVVTMCGDQLININNDPSAIEFLGKDTESFAAVVSVSNDGKVSSIVRISSANANLLAIKLLVATQTDADKTAIASIKKVQKAGVVISEDDKLLLILKSSALVENVRNVALAGSSNDRYRRLRLAGVSGADAVAICEATGVRADSESYLREEMIQIACSSIKNVAKLSAYLESKNVRVPKISPTSEWANALRNDESVMQVIAGAGLKKAAV
jgi:hypothetical protein